MIFQASTLNCRIVLKNVQTLPIIVELVISNPRTIILNSTIFQICIFILQGDSGGPLVLQNSQTVIGILNFGDPSCHELENPGVYARTNSFIPFIEKAMDGEIIPDDNIRVGVYTFKKRFWIESMHIVETNSFTKVKH